MTDPSALEQAIAAMQAAEEAFRFWGLLKDDECTICYRMLSGGGLHGADCAIELMRQARLRVERASVWLSTELVIKDSTHDK